MGLAGALYVSFIGFVSPFDFLPILTFQIWAMVIVGGQRQQQGCFARSLVVWGMWAGSGVPSPSSFRRLMSLQGGAIQVILIGVLLVVS